MEAYKIPVLQCLNCQKYGHFAKYCKNKTVCVNCAADHNRKDCKTKQPKCANCTLTHPANSKLCGVYKTQDKIRKKMQELKILYRESRYILQRNTTYAQILMKKLDNYNRTVNQENITIKEHKENHILYVKHQNQDHIPLKRKYPGTDLKIKQKKIEINMCLIAPNGKQEEAQNRASKLAKKGIEEVRKATRETLVEIHCAEEGEMTYKQVPTITEKWILQRLNSIIQEIPD